MFEEPEPTQFTPPKFTSFEIFKAQNQKNLQKARSHHNKFDDHDSLVFHRGKNFSQAQKNLNFEKTGSSFSRPENKILSGSSKKSKPNSNSKSFSLKTPEFQSSEFFNVVYKNDSDLYGSLEEEISSGMNYSAQPFVPKQQN